MTYHIAAHETRYAGHLFRSRLEARWAAMFDLLGWQWTYEPFDLNGWVPDFLLAPLTDKGSEVLVEVKGPPSEWEAAKEKAEVALSESGTCLIVGAAIFLPGGVGELLCRDPFEGDLFWCKSQITKLPNGLHDICDVESEWAVNDCFHYDLTGINSDKLYGMDRSKLIALWGRAHEKTRYTPR